MLAQVVEQVPGIKSAVVTVGEDQTQGVGTNRLDTLDIDVAFARLLGPRCLYLQKPFAPAALAAALRRLLDG